MQKLKYLSTPATKETSEMSKKEMFDLALQLEAELKMMKKTKNDLILEQSKAQKYLDISNKKQEETRARLIRKRLEMEENDKRRREEITHYQEKLKQIQLEHSNAITEMKGDIASSSSLQTVQHAESELKLNKTIHDLEAEWREKRRNHAAMIRDLMLKQHQEKIKMVRSYDAKLHEVEQKGAQARDSGMTEWLMKQDQARDTTNKTMMAQDEPLIVEAQKLLKAAWDRFSQIGQEIMKAKKEIMLNEKLEKQRKHEEEGLKRDLLEVQELREKLKDMEEEWQQLEATKRSVNEMMTRYRRKAEKISMEKRDLTVKNELLRQATLEVEEEIEALKRKETETIRDIQQKNSLKRMVLERKTAAAQEALEIKAGQQSVSSPGPEIRRDNSKKLQELKESKDKKIAPLQDEIAQVSGVGGADRLVVQQLRL